MMIRTPTQPEAPRWLALRLAVDERLLEAMTLLALAWIYLQATRRTPRQLARRTAPLAASLAGLGLAAWLR